MRVTGWLKLGAGAVALAGLVALPAKAAADTMDPALNRLVHPLSRGCLAKGPDGTGSYYNPQSGFSRCVPDNGAFAKLVAQYGFAIAPTAMRSARSTGYGGFEFSIEADYTKIDSGAQYWQDGTQGPQDPTTKRFSITNKSPDSLMQLYSLKIRKGFPFGLELGGQFGYLAHTSIITGGADVRLSLLEGFRAHIPGIFPDVAVGGSVRTITGTEQMQLTVAGFDAQISKQIPIAGTVQLTPYVGYSWIRIFGNSGLVDFTPNTDSLNACGYAGPNIPGTPGAKAPYDGQPVCKNGTAADFNNSVVFDEVRLTRHRIDFGMQLRVQVVKFGAHFITDLISPEDANQGPDYQISKDPVNDPSGSKGTESKFAGLPKQWTLAFELGAAF
jgi:hypothetical protein